MSKFLIAAGGTGGHIYPAVAIAKELQKSGSEVIMVGNENGVEREIYENNGLECVLINVQKLYRKVTLDHIHFPIKLIKSIIRAKKIIKKEKIDAVIGTGSFVTGPVAIGALMLKKKLFLQEQNSYPGLTNRYLAKYADKIYLGNSYAKSYLKKGNCLISGNPVNPNSVSDKGLSEDELLENGLSKDSFKILIMGGSQGAITINNVIIKIVDALLVEDIEIIWQCGKKNISEYEKIFSEKKGVYVFGFSENIGKYYKSVKFVVSRAGALSIADFEANKLPALLIPLKIAAGDHQLHNAKNFVSENKGLYITEDELDPEILLKKIMELKADMKIYENSFSDKSLNAARTIVKDICLEMGEKC